GNIVKLTRAGVPATENNTHVFGAADVSDAASTITLNRNGATVFNAFELGQAVVYRAPVGGTAIANLVDGGTYYVVASTNEHNLQGNSRFADTQVLRLAESENESRAGVFIDIGPAVGSGHQLYAKHVLDSGFATGIGVVAQLEATDKATASAGLNSESADPAGLIDRLKEVPGKLTPNIADALLQGATKNYRDVAGKPQAGASGSFSIAGGLAFTYADHVVKSDVLANAVLQSNEDLEVKALITQKFNIGASSSTKPQEQAGGGSSASSAPNNASVAVAVNVTNNTALATVHGGGQLDALRALRVISDVSYPILTRFDQFIPLSWGELTDSIRTEGYGAITKYLNSNLGAVDAFFNTWTSATSEADNIGVAGSVSVLAFKNRSEAVVKTGAALNQNLAWRRNADLPGQPGTSNPHVNQAAQQSDRKGEQVVSVEATNYQQTINMTGVFSLPDFGFDAVPIIGPSPAEAKLWQKYHAKKSLSLNPAGVNGGKGGAGGAIFISVQDNVTHAIVQDGASVYSGLDGGFNMKAEEAILNVNLAQSWANGKSFAIGGTVLYSGQTSDTLAQLGAAATVTGRDARLYAGDLTTNVTWAGGIAKGEALGVGISVAINDLDRKTRALIGAADAVAGTPVSAAQRIDVADGVSTLARVDGDIWAFTVAGAVAKAASDVPAAPTAKQAPAGPAQGQAIPGVPAAAGAAANEAKTGIAVAAAASINLVRDDIQASIADAGRVKAGFVSVDAVNDLGILAVTGGLAFAKVNSGAAAVALAGAFSLNRIDSNTRASVQDTHFTLSGNAIGEATSVDTLRVNGENQSRIFALAAGGAGAVASGTSTGGGAGGSTAVAVAGSVTVNLISGQTSAVYSHNLTTLTLGNARVTASDRSLITASAGGLAFSAANGQQG
ncbi:MAG TPA: hypothetical protein VK439_00205, partial [Rubrivivax sp.]|nr:hypothetical protein [Rubrivivax sp.]